MRKMGLKVLLLCGLGSINHLSLPTVHRMEAELQGPLRCTSTEYACGRLVCVNAVKIFADGVIECPSQKAALVEPQLYLMNSTGQY
ncbi:MAG: hypothetical protein ACHQIL_07670 [Steroidobacterales bacterium]